MFSFAKDMRFKDTRKSATNTICYDVPNGMSKKTCSFGVGNRFKKSLLLREMESKLSWTELTNFYHIGSPPPNQYELPSEFGRPGTVRSNGNGKMFSFGLGREKLSKK
jgi:hypothetical protein